MNNEKQKKELADGLTRRGFLTLGGVAALGAGAALAGCSPQASSASSAGDAATAASAADAAEGHAPSPWGDYYPWPANPPEITDDMVEEELDCDVAVVGLGVSGVAAFRAASEGGAKVVGIEKGSMPQQRSSQYCYLNGKLTDTLACPTSTLRPSSRKSSRSAPASRITISSASSSWATRRLWTGGSRARIARSSRITRCRWIPARTFPTASAA